MTRYLWILAVIAIALVTAVGNPSGANAQLRCDLDPITGGCIAEPPQCQPIPRDWTNDFFNLWGAVADADVDDPWDRLGRIRNCMEESPVFTGVLGSNDYMGSMRGSEGGIYIDAGDCMEYYRGCLQFCECKALALGRTAGDLCSLNCEDINMRVCSGWRVTECPVFVR